MSDCQFQHRGEVFAALHSHWSGACRLGGYNKYFSRKHGVYVAVSTQAGLQRHRQCGNILFVLCFFVTLEYVATVFVQWVEFFLSLKLQNGYVDETMSPEPESTKWWLISGWSIPSKQPPEVGLLLLVKILQVLVLRRSRPTWFCWTALNKEWRDMSHDWKLNFFFRYQALPNFHPS